MLINPMPAMESQVGKFGLLGFVDLNCGWYCAKAMLAYWFEVRHGRRPHSVPLPNGHICAYDPYFDSQAMFGGAIQSGNKPTTAAAWKTKLQADGPIIVSGKLGAADWGSVAGKKLGVGHFILIVGASARRSTLSYKDPLQGDTLKTEDFNHMDRRIDNDVYWTTAADAAGMFTRMAARLKPM